MYCHGRIQFISFQAQEIIYISFWPFLNLIYICFGSCGHALPLLPSSTRLFFSFPLTSSSYPSLCSCSWALSLPQLGEERRAQHSTADPPPIHTYTRTSRPSLLGAPTRFCCPCSPAVYFSCMPARARSPRGVLLLVSAAAL
jgi:hypothetical protein